QARILAPLTRPGLRESGRLNLPQISNCTFSFRNDLLGDGENQGTVDQLLLFFRSIANECGQVVASTHFRQIRQRDYFDAHTVRRKMAASLSCELARSSATSSGVSISNISPGRGNISE